MDDPYDLNAKDAAEADRKVTDAAARQQQVEDLKWLLSHPAGRRIVARILGFTGTRRTSFSTNGSTMAMNEGRRMVGLWLEGEVLEVSPEMYLRMLKEFQA